jgi:cytochrome bd-type quinol oxidase subunit 2
LQLLILSLIVFSVLGFITTAFHQNTFFLGVGTLKEQFTAFDGILYNWTLVVTSENLGASLFAGLLVLFLYLAAEKWKFKGNNFKYLAIFLFIVAFIVYGFVLHQLRYSQSEPDLARVIVFWAIGGVLTALTGSIIPFLAMHGMNNTFVELSAAYSKETALVPIIIFIVVLVVIYILLFVRRKKKT